MKRLGVVFLCVLSWVHCGQMTIQRDINEGRPMPSVNMLLLDSVSVLNTNSLSKSEPVILIFFDPYCQYCRSETESILSKIQKFGNTQICFLGVAPISDMNRFSIKYQLSKYPNIHIGIDTAGTYARYFAVEGVPHTSIFLKNRKAKKIFYARVDAEKLIDVID
ncbi:hypothetical protein HHL17_26545 [Chitinophaga sp. G-6-1-13]|uniref:Thioredoxin domain-containing protein n=1 Tax=Chitinophaga fulva TaxID=2728842 RepID=A0A848GQ94_9BACT|nr:hypothetical protein [Chitinophaga fulva]NML40785.1 hypothetical protein [Chitinophaga fulva]